MGTVLVVVGKEKANSERSSSVGVGLLLGLSCNGFHQSLGGNLVSKGVSVAAAFPSHVLAKDAWILEKRVDLYWHQQ